MKKFIYLAVIILISFACKKDDDASSNISKIDTIIETSKNASGVPNDTVTYKYNYNTTGDITEMYASHLGFVVVRSEYKYINTSLIMKTVTNYSNTNDSISNTIYIKLDSKGLATQDYFIMSFELTDSYSFVEYKYDRNNQKIESKKYFGSSLSDYSVLIESASYIITDGNTNNIITKNYEDGQPVNSNRMEYTYFKKNNNTLGNSNTGMGFYGASNVNPTRETYNTNGTKTEHTYEYDNQNRITKQTIHREFSGSKTYIYYAYTYK